MTDHGAAWIAEAIKYLADKVLEAAKELAKKKKKE